MSMNAGENGGALSRAARFLDDEEAESLENYQQFLTFAVSEGEYGIDILETHEILKPQAITRLPNVQEEVLGVINLRGNIIPIVDLNKKFQEDFTVLDAQTRIVVVNYHGKYSGLLVDRVLEVARVPEDGVEAAEVRGLSNEYISGVGRSDERLFLILNLDRVFAAMHPESDQPEGLLAPRAGGRD